MTSVAKGFLPRLLGLMPVSWRLRVRGRLAGEAAPKRGCDDADALFFPACSCVHTCFMACRVDLAFVARDGCVLAAQQGVPPWRVVRAKGAYGVLERLSCSERWPVPGEFLPVSDWMH